MEPEDRGSPSSSVTPGRRAPGGGRTEGPLETREGPRQDSAPPPSLSHGTHVNRGTSDVSRGHRGTSGRILPVRQTSKARGGTLAGSTKVGKE